MFDSLVILYGEIRCLSLLGVKGFEGRMTMLVLYEATAKKLPRIVFIGYKSIILFDLVALLASLNHFLVNLLNETMQSVSSKEAVSMKVPSSVLKKPIQDFNC